MRVRVEFFDNFEELPINCPLPSGSAGWTFTNKK